MFSVLTETQQANKDTKDAHQKSKKAKCMGKNTKWSLSEISEKRHMEEECFAASRTPCHSWEIDPNSEQKATPDPPGGLRYAVPGLLPHRQGAQGGAPDQGGAAAGLCGDGDCSTGGGGQGQASVHSDFLHIFERFIFNSKDFIGKGAFHLPLDRQKCTKSSLVFWRMCNICFGFFSFYLCRAF